MNKKCGTISILGRPNVGKSTLMNSIIGEKIAIVSAKPQTTRNRIIGVRTDDDCQFVFMDTPGLHSPKSKLGDAMVRTIYETAANVDAALLVVTPDGEPRIGKPEGVLIEKIKQAGISAVLAINKSDITEKPEILRWIDAYSKTCAFTDIVPISAKTGYGVDELLSCLKKHLPEAEDGHLMFADDEMTDQSERVLAAELVREKLLWHLEREVPHGIACITEEFADRGDGIVDISIAITCEKDSHKGIVIGKQGGMLKLVGTEARGDMEKLFNCKVFLTLWVRVRSDWKNNDYMLKDFGY